jgi:hypothetical protein
MPHYIALIHKDADSSYGVSFPDVPGVIAAGDTIDERCSTPPRSWNSPPKIGRTATAAGTSLLRAPSTTSAPIRSFGTMPLTQLSQLCLSA